jgi:hypothetical protein
MDRYLITSFHTAEDCRMAVKHFREYHSGFLSHFEWGCYDNDHHAYAIIEANSHDEAKLSVPPLFRDKATAVRLTTFKPGSGKDPMHTAPKPE